MEKNKVLESLSYGVENKYLKKVLNNNKTSYGVIKVPFTLDETCIIVDDDVMIDEQDNGDENTEKLRKVEFEFTSFKRFILGEFCDVKESLLADLHHFKKEVNASISHDCFDQHNPPLVTKLEDEILFLRNELKSKDTIIKMLIQNSVEHNDKKFNDDKIKKNDENIFKVKQYKKNSNHKSNTNKIDLTANHEMKANYFCSPNRYAALENMNELCENSNESPIKKFINDNLGDITENRESNREQFLQHNNDNENNKDRKVITILGDSMVQKVKGYQLAKSLSNKNRVVVKSFAGATTSCMHHYIKPTLEKDPDIVILHTGTNDLKKEDRDPKQIAKDIINLVYACDTDNNTVIVSSLVPRNDKLRKKSQDVNYILQQECNRRNIGYINHDNINVNRHLNGSKLHLNEAGTGIIAKNFINFLKFTEN